MFERVEKTLFEIKSKLMNSKKIQKLLFYDSNAALEMDDLAADQVQQIDEFITLAPIYTLTEDYKKNAIIHIEMDSADNVDNSIDGVIRVNIVMNKDKWVLINNKLRPLVITDEVIRLVDKIKFSTSNTLEFIRIIPLIINKNITGYALLFDLVDGVAELSNI